MRTVVLIHGAWHGPWCWERVTPLLDQAGVPHREVELPFTSHADDVAAARAALDSIDGVKVLVGHSYGGLVVSGAAARRSDIDHLVYLCAFLVEEGKTIVDATADAPPDAPRSQVLEALRTHDDGSHSIEPD